MACPGDVIFGGMIVWYKILYTSAQSEYIFADLKIAEYIINTVRKRRTPQGKLFPDENICPLGRSHLVSQKSRCPIILKNVCYFYCHPGATCLALKEQRISGRGGTVTIR
jgi:hypothetical protein